MISKQGSIWERIQNKVWFNFVLYWFEVYRVKLLCNHGFHWLKKYEETKHDYYCGWCLDGYEIENYD